MKAPIIATQRLILRAHRPDDFEACAAMWADPAITQSIGGAPSTREKSWGRFLQYAGLWPLLGYGYWAIEEQATHRFAGELGLADFKRDLLPPIAGLPELGWVIATPLQRRGYATEALRAILAWTDANLAGRSTVCLIAPENHASMRLAAGAGFVAIARPMYHARATILLERLAMQQEQGRNRDK